MQTKKYTQFLKGDSPHPVMASVPWFHHDPPAYCATCGQNDKLNHHQPTPYAILGQRKRKEKDNYF